MRVQTNSVFFSNINFLFKKEFFLVSIILVTIILIFASDVVFFGKYYTANDYLSRFSPWDQYPPQEFGNFNSLLEDQALNLDPRRRLLYQNFQDGNFPLWNPTLYVGAPWTNDGNRLFSPMELFSFLFPLNLSFNLMLILKLYIAGIGCYFFLRELKCNIPGSLVAAISFMLSGSMVLLSGTHSITSVVMVLPLLFLFTHRIVNDVSWKNFVFLSLAFAGTLLGGHGELATLFIFTVIFYFTYQFFLKIKNKELDKKVRLPSVFFGSFGLGILVSFVHLLTYADYLLRSMVWIERNISDRPSQLSYVHIIANLLPEFFGRPTSYVWYAKANFHAANFGHVGIVSIFLGLIAAIFLFVKNNEVKFFSIATVIFFGITYALPGFEQVYSFIPGLNLVSHQFSGFVLAFLLSVLAGFGTDYLSKKHIPRKKIILVALLILLFFGFIASYYTTYSLENPPTSFRINQVYLSEILYDPPSIYFESKQSELIIFLALLISVVICIIIFLIKKISKKIFHFILISILIVAMLEFGMNFAMTSENYEVPTTPSIDFLKEDNSLFRIFPIGVILEPDSHMNYNLSSIRGNDILRNPAYVEFFRSLGDVRGNVDFIATDYSSPLLDLLNVKYVLIPSFAQIQDANGRYELAFQDKSVKVLENKDILPRAFMVYEYVEIPDIDYPKDWFDFKFLKGWIKGSKSGDFFEIKIYGPTKNDYYKFLIIDDSKAWKEFTINLKHPVEISGKPNLSKVIKLELMGTPFSENENFRVKELKLSNEFLKIQHPGGQPLWLLQEFDGGDLDCNISYQEGRASIISTQGGNSIECNFVYNFENPADFSHYKVLEYWSNRAGAYQLYLFGPTMNDSNRYDDYQFSERLSKINVKLDAPSKIQGNPDLTNIIKIRLDPVGGRKAGSYYVTEPILYETIPLEILYKSHHSIIENEVEKKVEECSTLYPSQLIGRLDPKFISQITTHQPKDLFFFEKIEVKSEDRCKLILLPKYSETLFLLRNPDFDNRHKIIINDEIDDKIKNELLDKSPNENNVNVVKYESDYQQINVYTKNSGFLFISDLYYPGWKAYVDDIETKIYRTNWAFRSIHIPEGEHLVEFRYEPESFLIGSMVSAVALSFILVGSIVQTKKFKIRR